MHITVEEKFIQSKTGRMNDCEDAVFINDNYFAVIDGATSKTELLWDGEKSGRVISRLLTELFSKLAVDVTAREAVDTFTAAVQDLYRSIDYANRMSENPGERMCAVFAAVSKQRRELWIVGDCQCLIDGNHFQRQKEGDLWIALMRQIYLNIELIRGKTIEQLRENDTGRNKIMPFLRQQEKLHNNPQAGSDWFPVINGFHVPDEGIRIIPITDSTSEIVLASDGYPMLENTLEKTEKKLAELIKEDPLMFERCRELKGVMKDNISFDDRTYLKLKISHQF